LDFKALAKATPGYVGADLSALTAAAGIIACKRIFQQLSDSARLMHDQDMLIDSQEGQFRTSTPLPSSPTRSIAHFLNAYPNPLTEEQLAPLCITFADFIAALKDVQPSSKREGFATVPDVTWSDIGALHEIREELQMAIVQPIRRPELFKAVGIDAPCGVLLWGPPGCGKTLLAKAVANESRANFISVKGPELLNKVIHYLFVVMVSDVLDFSMSGKAKGQ
jgi:ribosome biogenesis ATPase